MTAAWSRDVARTLQDRGRDRGELGDLIVGEVIEDVPSNGPDVERRGFRQDRPAVLGECDIGSSTVVIGRCALHQSALGHAIEMVRKTAGRPPQSCHEIAEAAPVARRLGQVREHLIIGVGQRRVSLEISRDLGQCEQVHSTKPSPRCVFGLVEPFGR
jgi:hypothetical protein